MFKLLKSKNFIENIDRLFPYFDTQKSQENKRVFFNKQLDGLKDSSKDDLSNVVVLLACFFKELCRINGILSLQTHNPKHSSLQLAFIINMQNNVRLCRRLLENFVLKNFEDPLFFNTNSNKVHMKDSLKIRSSMESAITKEIHAYIKIRKIRDTCTEYHGKLTPSNAIQKTGYTEVVFSNEYLLFERINKTAVSRKDSNTHKLLCIKKELTDNVNSELIVKTENKTFSSFIKNVIKTVFGVTCLFGASFWDKKTTGAFTNNIKASLVSEKPTAPSNGK